MNEQRDRAFVRESVDQGLSSLKGDPFLAQRVIAQVKGKEEVIVKKKISVSIILVAVLLFTMAGAALAAGLGLFGQLSGGSDADERLSVLEQTAETVETARADSDDVTVEIGQAYYEGDRVFISYRLSGSLTNAALHEGKPDRDDIVWDTVLENFICAEEWESDYPEIQKADLWLDGKDQHWAETQVIGLHDGLYLADGTYADIIGGDAFLQPDGSVIGWKECVIPADHLAEELTFKAILFRLNTVAWQDGTTYRACNSYGENTEIAFTLARNEHYAALKGTAEAGDHQAEAMLEQGRIDMRGSITVTCPAVWVTQMTEPGERSTDMIEAWNLYQSGRLLSADGCSGIGFPDENTLVFDLLYPHMDSTEGLALVPVYSQSGEHMDEAIVLRSAAAE